MPFLIMHCRNAVTNRRDDVALLVRLSNVSIRHLPNCSKIPLLLLLHRTSPLIRRKIQGTET